MPISIGSNIAALQAQRRLTDVSNTQSSVFERLASGQRINRASDDAAGLAISESLRTDVRVFNQANRNINDGISMFSIAEGAIDSLKNILFRIRELSTQAANGAYSYVQREALDTEAQALLKEYNRIIGASTFNGRNVFDESNGVLAIQAGYGTDGIITSEADTTFDVDGGLVRVSTTSTGAEATGGSSGLAQTTASGRYLVFQSTATNLVSGDTNAANDVFLKDLSTGQTTRISTTSQGTEATGGGSYSPQITPDGQYAVFSSDASNLVSGDTNGLTDIFVKNILTGQVTRVSTTSSDVQALGNSTNAQITADGRYVLFQSDATNLVSSDTNATIDIFLKDLQTGLLTRVNVDSNGNQATGGISSVAQITPDGRYVLFQSDATNLVSGDTNGTGDIFMKDLVTGMLTRVSTNSAGDQGNAHAADATITPDGKYVTFRSNSSNVFAGDTNGTYDVYVKELSTGNVALVSSDSAGTIGNGLSIISSTTSDARYVTYYSQATNLVSGDTNALRDIFVKDLLTGQTSRVNVNNSGTQASGGLSSNPRITPDGRYIIFDSVATNLVSGDTNAQSDIFIVKNPLAAQYSIGLLHSVSLKTQSGAQYMQTHIDSYLTEVNNYQSQLGAAQQRFSTASRVLSSIALQSTAANSRIRDADVAQDSAELLRSNILSSAASKILSQANQQPALALKLLQFDD
jgi:flagellin-like hook-associated protein FlgL